LWPAPLSTVWHCAHLVLKIFSPALGLPGGASENDAIAAARTRRDLSRRRGGGELQLLVFLPFGLAPNSQGPGCSIDQAWRRGAGEATARARKFKTAPGTLESQVGWTKGRKGNGEGLRRFPWLGEYENHGRRVDGERGRPTPRSLWSCGAVAGLRARVPRGPHLCLLGLVGRWGLTHWSRG
jgi:hypothetical protein